MLYVDRELKESVRNGFAGETQKTAIENGSESCVTNIGYDLVTERLFKETGKPLDSYTLEPGESVFVETKEHIYLSSRTVGIVSLKNSRIRMGLTLDAPVYQPGHKTPVFFRLTNVTDKKLTLRAGEQYAMLMLYQLNAAPDEPYTGAFQGEYKFDGMGNYNDRYADQIQELDEKTRNLKDIEKSLYGNVITILTIFIGIFTLLNVNIDLVKTAASVKDFLTFNLAMIGALSFLSVLLEELLNRKEARHWLWAIPAVLYGLLLVIAFVL